MAIDNLTTPPDEWLKLSDDERAELQRRIVQRKPDDQPTSAVTCEVANCATEQNEPSGEGRIQTPTSRNLDDAFQQAAALAAVDQVKLIARLWTMLPATHRAALLRVQLNEIQTSPPAASSAMRDDAFGRTIKRFLFDRGHTSDLYSAPRRFDLATIFVVTAAYSIILGGMSALDSQPITKIFVVGLVTLVAAGQALFHDRANPRGVSVIIGAAASTLFSWILWLSDPGESLIFVTIIGFVFGAILGYIAGVVVGGMFLVADLLRRRYLASEANADVESAPDPFTASRRRPLRSTRIDHALNPVPVREWRLLKHHARRR
jgi:hypothetical protein